MNTQELKQQAHKDLDEKFGDNFVWWQECIAEMRIGDPDFNRLKSFIDSLIDKTVQVSEERAKFLLNDLQETFYTEIQKVDNRYKNSSVDIQQAKWSHSNEIRLIFSKLKSNFLESLITNKSDINK